MLLAAPLKCVCGCKPKLGKGNYNYVRYYCPNCGMGTFHHRLEELARDSLHRLVLRLFLRSRNAQNADAGMADNRENATSAR